MMNNGGYSYGDLVAMTRNNNDRDNNFFGEDLLMILFLVFIMNGGRFNGYGNGNGVESAMTRAEVMEGFNFNQLDNGIRSIERGMCEGFSNQNVAMLQGFNEMGRGIDQARFDMQNCC